MRKFEFERSFDAATVRRLEIVPPPEPPPPPPPSFSSAELEAARTVAFARGRDAGLQEAAAAIERRLADATERLALALEQARSDQTELVRATQRQAAETMLGLVETLLPSLARREALAEIEALIEEALSDGFGQPRLLIRCSQAYRARIETIAAEAAARAGYTGVLTVQADANLAAEDCRIEWSSGGVERQTSRALESITTAMRTALAEPTEEFAT